MRCVIEEGRVAERGLVVRVHCPAFEARLPLRVWCRRRDLNPHGLRHTPLKRACLPFHHFGNRIALRRHMRPGADEPTAGYELPVLAT